MVKGKLSEDVRLGFRPDADISCSASWEFAGPGLKGPETDLSVDWAEVDWGVSTPDSSRTTCEGNMLIADYRCGRRLQSRWLLWRYAGRRIDGIPPWCCCRP